MRLLPRSVLQAIEAQSKFFLLSGKARFAINLRLESPEKLKDVRASRRQEVSVVGHRRYSDGQHGRGLENTLTGESETDGVYCIRLFEYADKDFCWQAHEGARHQGARGQHLSSQRWEAEHSIGSQTSDGLLKRRKHVCSIGPPEDILPSSFPQYRDMLKKDQHN
ncbi:hypothetical protein FPOAC2_13614 [Fusarium poae]|jgi:hypothetical protein